MLSSVSTFPKYQEEKELNLPCKIGTFPPSVLRGFQHFRETGTAKMKSHCLKVYLAYDKARECKGHGKSGEKQLQ